MRIFHDLNVDFMGKRRIFYTISSVILIFGLINIFVRGFSFGIDFKGGVEVTLKFDNPVNITELRDKASNIGLGSVEAKTFGDETSALLRTGYTELPAELLPKVQSKVEDVINAKYPQVKKTLVERTATFISYHVDSIQALDGVVKALSDGGFQASKLVSDSVKANLTVRLGVSDWIKSGLREQMTKTNFDVQKSERVVPLVGKELKRNALWAIALSLIVILVYLGFRFKFSFASGAVLALFHDIFLTLGIFSAFNGLIPWLNLDISVTVVGAFLTLIGYSMMDTVVVFDRVREYMKIYKTLPLDVIMNKAINKTMSRTVITAFTTLISVTVLLIFGGEVLRSFAFCLFIGIITGTYSSIFVASVFVLEYSERTHKKIEF